MADVPGWAYAVVPPLWVWAGFTAVRTIRDWPNVMARWNERQRDAAEIESGQVDRMDARMLRLEQRCAALELAHQECLENLQNERDGRAAEHAGRLEAEALLMARQRSDQSVQVRLSAEREVDASARTADRAEEQGGE
jgi:hypothetical protein